MNRKLMLSFANIFVLSLLMCTSLYSQSRTNYNLFSVNDNSSLINTPELKQAVSDAMVLSISKGELQRLSENKNPKISIDIPYSNNHTARLNLERFDILKPDAKIVARTANGNEEVKLDDIAYSYKGNLEGVENTLVTLTFTKENVIGLMVSGNDNYVLGPLKDAAGNETENYILYKETDLKVKNNFHCATEDNLTPEYIDRMQKVIMQSMNDASATDLYVCEVALELDFFTYGVYGSSVVNTTNYALALMAASSAIYMKEVNVRFVIPYIRVWTTTDPYTGTNSNTLLNQFRAEWNANQNTVVHHLADSHLNAFIRFKLALTEDTPTIKAYYEDKWAELGDYKSTPAEVSLNLLDSLHIRWINLLRSMSPKDFTKTFFHPEYGKEFSLDEIAAMYSWHCRHHYAHINELKKRMNW